LAQLLQGLGPQVSPAAQLATGQGVSRTTLNQLLNPELLLGTGVASPSALTSDYERYVQSERDVLRRAAEEDLLKAQQDWVNKRNSVVARYTVEPPQFFSDVASRYANDAFVTESLLIPIQTGAFSASQVKTQMAEPKDIDFWSQQYAPLIQQIAAREGRAEVNVASELNNKSFDQVLQDYFDYSPDQVFRLKEDLDSFESEARTFRRNLLEYEEESEQASRDLASELELLGPAPVTANVPELDTDAAWRDYSKSLGLEGLSLLPDPQARYDVPTDMILDRRRAARPSGQTLAEELLARQATEQRQRGVVEAPSRFQGVEATKIPGVTYMQAPSRSDAERQEARRLLAAATIPQGLGRPVVTAPTRTGPSGVPFRVPERSAAVAQALAANQPTEWLRQAAEAEQAAARLESAAIGRGLAAAGRTPFQDAMAQMLRYGVLEAGA